MIWEAALGMFAPSGFSMVGRDQVAQDGQSDSWYSGFTVISNNTQPPPYNYDAYRWWPWTDSKGNQYYYVAGVNLNWTYLSDPTGPLATFVQQPLTILNPLVWSPNQDDTTSVWSFDAGAQAVRGTDAWLQEWIPRVQGWANDIDVPDSDFQGSAAGVFKSLLLGFANEMQKLHLQIAGSNPPADALATARQALGKSHVDLYDAYAAWRATPLVWPAQATLQVLNDQVHFLYDSDDSTYHSQGGKNYAYTTTTADISIMTDQGDPATQDFWDRVQSLAKAAWTQNVVTGLDDKTDAIIAPVQAAYQNALAAIPDVLDQVQLIVPTGTPPAATTSTDPTDTALNTLAGDVSGLGTSLDTSVGGLGTALDKGLAGAGAGPLDTSVGGLGTAFDKGVAGAGPVGVGSVGVGSSLLGSPSLAGSQQLFNANGTAALDSSGAPIMVPTGSHINAAGEVIGPDGKPVLGADGKPITAAKGSTIATPDVLLDAAGNPVLDANGNDITVPAGSKIGANGEIVGADGKPVLGADGKPITAPKGASLQPEQSGVGSTQNGGQSLGSWDNLQVPVGSHVSANGDVIGPNGKAVLGADGQPLVVPAGSTVNAQGVVLGADKQPLSASTVAQDDYLNSLANQPQVSSSLPGLVGGLGSVGLGGTSLAGLPGTGPIGRAGTVGTGDLGLPGVPSGSVLPGESALGGRALSTGGDPFVDPPAVAKDVDAGAGLSAEDAAMQESQLMSRTATQSGSPMMPPMGGGMGGGAGAGSERQRTTWLSEDEEVWGAHSTAHTGVIGR